MTEIYKQSKWDLSELFPSEESPEFKASFEQIETLTTDFETVKADLDDDISVDSFYDIIGRLEKITQLAQRMHSFAMLWFSENTQNQRAQVLVTQVEQYLAAINNRLLFFELWWKQLDRKAADRLMAGDVNYRYWLEDMRRFSPYTLSEPEEKIINIKDVTGAGALLNLYDSITNRYQFRLGVEGREKLMTRGELMVYAQHHRSEHREAAYRELYRVYGGDGPILGQIYQALVRNWRTENIDLRGHQNPMSVRNLSNDLSDEVVDTLLGVCRQNAPLFQRFFKLKARLLGLSRLRRYDLYAPMSQSDKTYDYHQSLEMVFEAFNAFSPELGKQAARVIEKDHLDSEVRPGKRDGAFCASTTPDLVPWVLVNYQGRPRDVATVAHELGHAVHSLLASHHKVFTFHASLPLAETASIFGEMLLIDHLLAREEDESVRLDLLFRQVDDAYASIMRQAYFAMFEIQAHDLIVNGETADGLSEKYLAGLKDQFGDSLEIAEEFRWEWVSIPHFYHSPFYVYAYAFGQLLVLSLYRQYKTEGPGFVPRFLKILAAGGSDSPGHILEQAGLDISRADFWQGGFDVLADLIDRLDGLVKR